MIIPDTTTYKMPKLPKLKVGDVVIRYLAGTIRMPLKVTAITKDRIVCELWEFDPITGAEIDDDLSWGPSPKMTGSFIVKEDA